MKKENSVSEENYDKGASVYEDKGKAPFTKSVYLDDGIKGMQYNESFHLSRERLRNF